MQPLKAAWLVGNASMTAWPDDRPSLKLAGDVSDRQGLLEPLQVCQPSEPPAPALSRAWTTSVKPAPRSLGAT